MIIRPQKNPNASLIEESEADIVRVSPTLHQKQSKSNNSQPKLPGSMLP